METNAENIVAIQNESEDTVDSRKESVVNIDFKMVAFSLAGKDYAIDILKVKEIANFETEYTNNENGVIKTIKSNILEKTQPSF